MIESAAVVAARAAVIAAAFVTSVAEVLEASTSVVAFTSVLHATSDLACPCGSTDVVPGSVHTVLLAVLDLGFDLAYSGSFYSSPKVRLVSVISSRMACSR